MAGAGACNMCMHAVPGANCLHLGCACRAPARQSSHADVIPLMRTHLSRPVIYHTTINILTCGVGHQVDLRLASQPGWLPRLTNALKAIATAPNCIDGCPSEFINGSTSSGVRIIFLLSCSLLHRSNQKYEQNNHYKRQHGKVQQP